MREKQLENALYAWPLKEVPSGFSTSVMEKINPRDVHAHVHQKIKLKFRLTWMDYALGIFLSLLPILAFITFILLPPKFVLYLEYQWLVLQFPAYETILLAIALSFAVLVLLVFVFSLRYLFPRPELRF